MATVKVFWKDSASFPVTTEYDVTYQTGPFGVVIRQTDTEWSFIPYDSALYFDFED